MLGKLWNIFFMLGLAATAYAVITGKDLNGTPTSMTSMDCSVIADEFIGDSLEIDYILRKVQRVDDMVAMSHSDTSLKCRGLAYLEGSPSTFVRLTATEQADGQYYYEMSQAYPEDYNCDRLAQEIIMKFSGMNNGDLGNIVSIANTQVNKAKPKLTCVGTAQFSGGQTVRLTYAYDGTQFSFAQ